jgi:serine/threonine-protein kinase
VSASLSTTNLLGAVLEGRYRITREIGRGGMGVVYEAEHTELGKRVAVKLMLEKYSDDTEAVSRFRREAFAASTIGNSHIIDVSHIGKAPDGRPFVVMELLIGQPLAQVIETTGPMAHWRAINIMRQVLRAVGAAHNKGIVHRDLKPDNIFLVEQDDQRDFVKLLDFGISKMMDGEGAVAHTKLTTTGMVMGTPLYMAPEQAMGTAIDHHADIYACGVILYEMLSGRPPFEGATFPVLIAKLLTTEPTPLLERVPGLPARLVASVHRALEKDPARRWHSCEEFYQSLPMPSSPSQIELAGTMGVGPTSMQMNRVSLPTPMGGQSQLNTQQTGGKKRTALWIALAAAAGVACAAVGVVVIQHSQAATPTPTPTPTPAATATATATPTPAAPPSPSPSPSKVTATASPLTGKLHVQGTPDGSAIKVDGKPLGMLGEKITVEIGAHKVRVEYAGYVPFEQDVQIGEDETLALEVKLKPLPPAPHGRLPGTSYGSGPVTMPNHGSDPVGTIPHGTVIRNGTVPPPIPNIPAPPPPRDPPQTPAHNGSTSPKPNPYGD